MTEQGVRTWSIRCSRSSRSMGLASRCADYPEVKVWELMKTQYKQCLDIILPGSPVFEYLEGLITRPADTYLTLAEMTEKEEKDKINKEIGNRSTRLGATKVNVTLEVRHEVLSASPVSAIFSVNLTAPGLMSHTA